MVRLGSGRQLAVELPVAAKWKGKVGPPEDAIWVSVQHCQPVWYINWQNFYGGRGRTLRGTGLIQDGCSFFFNKIQNKIFFALQFFFGFVVFFGATEGKNCICVGISGILSLLASDLCT